MGTMCLAGLLILLHRRLTNARVSAVTRFGDKVLLLWLLVTLLLGLSTIFESASHMDGHMMVQLMTWAQHIVTLRADAASYVAEAPLLFKAHLFMGISLFAIFPFTRLVHVWSGFASVTYLAAPGNSSGAGKAMSHARDRTSAQGLRTVPAALLRGQTGTLRCPAHGPKPSDAADRL
jgi:nitrate reductase gamma subunit